MTSRGTERRERRRGSTPEGPQRHTTDRWLYAAPVLALLHVVLLVALHARPGLPGVVLWDLGPTGLTVIAVLVMTYGLLRSVRARLVWTTGGAAGYACLMAVSAMPLAYTTYPSSRDHHPSEVQFRLPLDGPVTVWWGGPTREVNYHVFAPPERWAYDLLLAEDQRTFRGDGSALSDYYTYGRPVLAPAAGTVLAAHDGVPDTPIGERGGWRNPCGNHVVIGVGSGEFLFLCHLQPGSVSVVAGESVVSGQPLGRAGNSGRSSQPHVHVHLQTTMDPHLGEGIPLRFHDYRAGDRVIDRGIPTGGVRRQVVEHVGTRS